MYLVFASDSVLRGRHAVALECQMWPEGGKWKESSERVGSVILQSMVNNCAPAKSHTPNNMPIEAEAHHKTLPGCFMRLCCTPVTHTNEYMPTDTKRDSLGFPVAY